MPITAAMMTSDFNYILADIPQTVTVSGVTKSAVVNIGSLSKQDRQAGGFMADDQIEVHVKASDWGTLPTVGDKLTTNAYSGRTFRVVRVQADPMGTVRVLYCEGVNP
jgi:hypothetical protein